jgi:hypothetical protein
VLVQAQNLRCLIISRSSSRAGWARS